GLDIFRVGAEGSSDNLLLSAEYRFYPYMNTIHHGWVGYRFDDSSELQLGISRVPFGLLPYASHNFWFGVPYYLGLADDYDLGAKYVAPRGDWNFQLAFYKGSELSSASDLGRYSFDVVSDADAHNEESNQFNARVAYSIGRETGCVNEVGLSGQWGELANSDTDARGTHWAAAGHLDSRCGRWNLQFELARYGFDPANPPGTASRRVRLGAFESAYDVSAQGTLAVANVAYNLPLSGSVVDQVTCYNDYSALYKDLDADTSQLNTTGCVVGAGPLFLYVDVIRANNMVFFGNGSLAGSGERDWDTRFNINLGYYW
ncbi:MAG: hypothetical protein KDI19_16610, partial [Pseudomonadales bacterium]|nr:hypothetical protein [Pseudomonadales bacterium]